MSRNEISLKTRIMADACAREELGLEGLRLSEMRPIERAAYANTRRRLVRTLTKGRAYYTAADFQFS